MTGEIGLRHRIFGFTPAVILAAGLLLSGSVSAAAPKMTAAKAGTIGKPTGKIAFIREKDVWVMDATGANQKPVSLVKNADGRMNWAPDGRRIVFTRSGKVQTNLPDNSGGVHKVYDVFIAYLDSADNGNTGFWRRLTEDNGSRDPEWSIDGSKIIISKDLNANFVNAASPNYQICSIDPDGGSYDIFRKDWQNVAGWMTAPTVSPKGDFAFVLYLPQKQTEGTAINSAGIGVVSRTGMMTPLDSLVKISRRVPDGVAPAWSPDGQWIAYVDNRLTDGGLYIAKPDFSERYLVFAPPVSASLATYQPSFSPDSKWLTFGTTDGSVWICDIAGNGAKRISGPGTDAGPAWSKAAR
jgi:Tol biopolymer transport system component